MKRLSWSDHTQTQYYGSRCKAPESQSETTIIPVEYVGGVADEIRKVTWGQIMEADYPAREQTFLQAMRGY